MSQNINISRKMPLFWDHFEKVVFCPYIRNYSYFEKIMSVLKVVCCHISENNHISRRRKFTLKKSFLSTSPKIWQFKVKVLFFKFFGENSFCPYVPKYLDFEKNAIILRSLWKSCVSENISISTKLEFF